MAKITHQEMRRGQDVSQSVPQTQNYVVDDMSNADSQQQALDQRLAAFEEAQKQDQQVLVPQVKTEVVVPKEDKKKLEKIIFMGRHSKIVKVAEHEFEMSTITHRENNEIMTRLMRIGEAADLFTIRVLTLAFALRAIDGIKINLIDIEGTFSTDLDHNVALIDNMQLGMVERLYAAYEELVKESDQLVYGEAIKNS